MAEPTYNLKHIAELRRNLAVAAYSFEYSTIGPDDLGELSRALATVLDVSPLVVTESCRYLLQVPLTDDELHALVWRLAGNREQLRKDIPVPPWRGQAADEWVPLQISSVTVARNSQHQPGARFQFTVLAGGPAGMQFEQFWSIKYYRYVMKMMGFTSAHRGKYRMPMQDPRQFVSMRLLGLLLAKRSQERLHFTAVRVPGSMLDYNRSLLKMRYRLGFSCPQQFEHPCHTCAVGYVDCGAATHRNTYVWQHCTVCGQTAYCEPGARQCVQCQFTNVD